MRDVGRRTLAILREHAIGILTVTEHQIENAIASLAEEAKVVAESAGAAGIAALLTHLPEARQLKHRLELRGRELPDDTPVRRTRTGKARSSIFFCEVDRRVMARTYSDH